MNHPLVSIITVVFNGEKTLENTLKSIFNQTYPNIECIVIDGASKDKTIDIIKQYETKINYWISEPDKGLYDAMNKGLRVATGNYVFFLNADDVFFRNDVLEKVLLFESNADVYYGDAMFIDENENELGVRSKVTPHKHPDNLNWKSLKYGMVVSHQAFIVKRSIAPLYNTKYKIASDIDWMINVLKNASSIINTHLIIAKFKTGGTSTKRQKLAWKERYDILNSHYGIINNFFNHIYIVVRYLFKKK